MKLKSWLKTHLSLEKINLQMSSVSLWVAGLRIAYLPGFKCFTMDFYWLLFWL